MRGRGANCQASTALSCHDLTSLFFLIQFSNLVAALLAFRGLTLTLGLISMINSKPCFSLFLLPIFYELASQPEQPLLSSFFICLFPLLYFHVLDFFI